MRSQTDVFSPAIAAMFTSVLQRHTNEAVCDAIMHGNPGEFALEVNATYPIERGLSMMPTVLLPNLPPLPNEIK